ncbi:MAG: hypothetical protein CMJ40_07805 [Phycisphaerae bacterium]|nr:hypothetical protein [Phycisphaerae bacterium]
MSSKFENHERLVSVENCDSKFAAEALVILLAEFDIPADSPGVLPENYTSLQPKQGNGAYPVLVRESQLELARLTIEDARSDAQALDWEQVDVGERCDTLPLKPVPTTIRPSIRFIATLCLIALVAFVLIALPNFF